MKFKPVLDEQESCLLFETQWSDSRHSFSEEVCLGCIHFIKRKMCSLTYDPVLGHISTFEGIHFAAAHASLKCHSRFRFIKKCHPKGELFCSLLKHDDIRSIRGLGLFIALEFENERINQEVIKRCLIRHITDWFFVPLQLFTDRSTLDHSRWRNYICLVQQFWNKFYNSIWRIEDLSMKLNIPSLVSLWCCIHRCASEKSLWIHMILLIGY